jgi:hypothetical protein
LPIHRNYIFSKVVVKPAADQVLVIEEELVERYFLVLA